MAVIDKIEYPPNGMLTEEQKKLNLLIDSNNNQEKRLQALESKQQPLTFESEHCTCSCRAQRLGSNFCLNCNKTIR